MHQLFEEQVVKAPGNIAVVYEGQQLTYRELNEKSNQLARSLRDKGVKPDNIVGIMMERSCEMLVGILGILKAGGAYLPIDPEYPVDRITYMLEDSKAEILITMAHLAGRISFSGLTLNIGAELSNRRDPSNPANLTGPNHLAYVIYTSGSTGKPKGVLIEHRNLTNLIYSLNEMIYRQYPPYLKIALVAPYVFDASVKQIFAALGLGHTLYIVPEGSRSEGGVLLKYYAENGIDISDGTPAHLNLINNHFTGVGEIGVKHFIIGGEALPYSYIDDFYIRFTTNRCRITNVYGPTECCVDASIYPVLPESRMTSVDNIPGIVPIGKPLPNIRIYILDKNLAVLPVGIAGEIYISGAGVGRGYLDNNDLTMAKFISDPFVNLQFFDSQLSTPNSQLMYRTGDLARWLPDGNIEFLGRIDNQVKIRGYRIELGEIRTGY